MREVKTVLQGLMTQNDIGNYLELSRKSKVSELQFYRLENNLLDHLPLGVLKKIATTLNIPLSSLIEQLTHQIDRASFNDSLSVENDTLIKEYQQETISILESLLLQLPTVVYAVKNNPDLPANRLLPLLEPINQLLSSWGISSIEQVGDIVDYNPQEHELMDNDDHENITKVEIRYVGYRQQDKLLYRAKVTPVFNE
ncbi:helix-turn-helix domain-containing protein [Geminocystis herdmanii]|uniref:helix-turn-helix domain-containing protein n=1 Tax=Geminocystis herdmanii TaxID=669359 RepID=UPI00034DD8DC|nr:helix-turn-helix transcriptional regulator [Geminocystis herdmanii]